MKKCVTITSRDVFQVKQEDECGCEAEEKGAEYDGVYGAFPSSLHLISSTKATLWWYDLNLKLQNRHKKFKLLNDCVPQVENRSTRMPTAYTVNSNPL